MSSPHFLRLLDRAKEIHQKKSQDYTTDPTANPHENFDRANIIISWFPPEYKSYAGLVGQKLARLGALLSSGRAPENESIEDTFLDSLAYQGLFYDKWKRNEDARKPNCPHDFLTVKGDCINCGQYIPDDVIERRYNAVGGSYRLKS